MVHHCIIVLCILFYFSARRSRWLAPVALPAGLTIRAKAAFLFAWLGAPLLEARAVSTFPRRDLTADARSLWRPLWRID